MLCRRLIKKSNSSKVYHVTKTPHRAGFFKTKTKFFFRMIEMVSVSHRLQRVQDLCGVIRSLRLSPWTPPRGPRAHVPSFRGAVDCLLRQARRSRRVENHRSRARDRRNRRHLACRHSVPCDRTIDRQHRTNRRDTTDDHRCLSSRRTDVYRVDYTRDNDTHSRRRSTRHSRTPADAAMYTTLFQCTR